MIAYSSCSFSRENEESGCQEQRVVKANRMLVVLCICFALTSSFSKIGILDLANKSLIGMFCLMLVAVFSLRPQPKTSFLILSLTVLLHVIAFAFPISPKEGISTYFMFAFWVLFWLYIAINRNDFLRAALSMRKGLQTALIAWTLITALALLIPACYKVGWGGASYFTGFTTDSFEIAPIAMFMLAVDILLFRFDRQKGKALLLALVPLACVFAAGTRTYLVIVVIEFLILVKLMTGSNRGFIIVAIALVVLAVLLAGVTGIGNKFASSTIHSDDVNVLLDVFTNGRSVFWAIDLNAFLAGDFFNILFGHGFSYVYDINQAAVGARLYAHNDFLNVLLNFGVIGLGVYFAAFFPVLHTLRKRCGFTFAMFFACLWAFNAFFNMVYVYAIAVMGMGILFAVLCDSGRELNASLDRGVG